MRFALLLLLAALAGCGPALVPLPEQQPAVQAEDPPDHRFFVRMVVPSADRRIVKEIGGTAALFRWTGAEPAVRVQLPDPGPWVAQVEFAVTEPTFKETGPVTVEVLVNGRALGRTRYEAFGEKTISLPMPEDLLPRGGEAVLALRIDPVWVAPSDGARLGVLLKAMGFLRP
jgi:hypothetical protein